MFRVRVVQAVQVPAPVVGELGDAVAASQQLLPQVLRGADPTGQAAGHPNDGDGLVRIRRDQRWCHRGSPSAGQLVPQVIGQGCGVGVVEDNRGREAKSGLAGQPVAQLDRGQ